METKHGLSCVVLLTALLVFISVPVIAGAERPDMSDREQALTTYGKLPLYFIQNKGQVNPKVRFYVKQPGQTLYFTDEGIVFELFRNKAISKNTTHKGIEEKRGKDHHAPDEMERLVFTLKLDNTSGLIPPEGLDRQEATINSFVGSDKSKWKTGIPVYTAIIYKGVYKGIDLKIYGTGRDLEYEFIIHPGANPQDIFLTYDGIKGLIANEAGDLLIQTAFGELKETKPYIYQEIEGKRVVAGRFAVKVPATQSPHKYSYGFQVASYDTSHPLIIDPTLVYSTYLGGRKQDQGLGIAVDAVGNAYVTGYTKSTDFPTQDPYQGVYGGDDYDVFITKFGVAGNSIVYSTYLGGSDTDFGCGIAVDIAGNAYITGGTNSTDFPTQDPYQGGYGGGLRDTFVTKLSASGNTLVYSTYLGGDSMELSYGIAVDSSGNAYVTGYTESIDFPTQNSYQETKTRLADVFVTKFDTSGSALVYSTYLGGSKWDVGYGIAVDSSGNAYVAGYTESTDFPTQNPYQETKNNLTDAFITKLNASGSTPAYSTYLGGSKWDVGYGIAVDTAGNVYVTGYTGSTDFPTQNPYQAANAGDSDAFVTKLSPSGNALVYSTYLGGSEGDDGCGIAIDTAGNAYVAGYTESTDFPTQDPYQGFNAGGYDVFITKLNASGSTPAYSTYLGGSGTDEGEAIAVDTAENAYVAGYTGSNDFPMEDPYQGFNAGSTDAFIVKLIDDADDTTPPIADAGPDQTVAQGDRVTLDGSGSYDGESGIVSYSWTQTSGTAVSLSNETASAPSFGAPDVGVLAFQLTVTNGAGLHDIDTVTVTVTGPMCSISGYVRTQRWGRIGGVTVTFSNGGGTATTDANGTYSHEVPSGWSGTVTPSKSGYTFWPTSKSYSNVTSSISGQNYVGIPAATGPGISGYVRTQGWARIGGVTLTFSNGGGTATTDANGNYSHEVSSGWSGAVTPSKSGYTFWPTSKSYSNVTSSVSGQNYVGIPGQTQTPVLNVTPSNRNVSSGSGSTTFTVSNAGGGTMNWTASVTSGSSWLSITSGSSGTNTGTIQCSCQENTGAQRAGTIRVIVSGASGSPKYVTVTQGESVSTGGIQEDAANLCVQKLSLGFSVADAFAEVKEWLLDNGYAISIDISSNLPYLRYERDGSLGGEIIIEEEEDSPTTNVAENGLTEIQVESANVEETGNFSSAQCKALFIELHDGTLQNVLAPDRVFNRIDNKPETGWGIKKIGGTGVTAEYLEGLNWSQYNLVYILTHGTPYTLQTREEWSEAREKTLMSKYGEDCIKISTRIKKNGETYKWGKKYFSITNRFIKTYAQVSTECVVYNSSCFGSNEEILLPNAFCRDGNGARAYIGWDQKHTVLSVETCDFDLLTALIEGDNLYSKIKDHTDGIEDFLERWWYEEPSKIKVYPDSWPSPDPRNGGEQELPGNLCPCEEPSDYPDTVVATIPVGRCPCGIAVTPNGSYVYVTNQGDGTVSVIQTSNNTIIGEPIPVGDAPIGVVVTPNGNYVYVVNSAFADSTVSVIQTSNNEVIKTIPVGHCPFGVAVTPNGRYVYVTNNWGDTVSVIQTSSNTVIKTIPVSDGPLGIAVTPNGSYVYVTNQGDGTVSVIQTSNNEVIGEPIPVGNWPYGVTVTPDGNYVYVTNQYTSTDDDCVSVIQTSNNTVIKTILLGNQPFGVSATPNGNYVYIATWGDGGAKVIQTSSNTIIKSIRAGNGPTGIAVTPNGNYVYVVNSALADSTVSVIGF